MLCLNASFTWLAQGEGVQCGLEDCMAAMATTTSVGHVTLEMQYVTYFQLPSFESNISCYSIT